MYRMANNKVNHGGNSNYSQAAFLPRFKLNCAVNKSEPVGTHENIPFPQDAFGEIFHGKNFPLYLLF